MQNWFLNPNLALSMLRGNGLVPIFRFLVSRDNPFIVRNKRGEILGTAGSLSAQDMGKQEQRQSEMNADLIIEKYLNGRDERLPGKDRNAS